MPTQLLTRGPVQVREYVPDQASQIAYRDRVDLVHRVRIQERGPDVTVEVYDARLRLGSLTVPREAELELVRRLFGEVPHVRADRAAVQALLQRFEDAVLSADPQRVISAWRQCFEVYDTMSRDIATLAALPEQGRGAA